MQLALVKQCVALLIKTDQIAVTSRDHLVANVVCGMHSYLSAGEKHPIGVTS